MSVLKMYLSQEDNFSEAELVEAELGIEIPEAEPVTEEELYEAEAVLEDDEDELDSDALSVDEELQAVDEAVNTVATLERYKELLEYGLEHKEFSPQFAAAVHGAMESYAEVFGTEGIVSLENYSHDNLEEFYRVSCESISGFIKRLVTVIPNAGNRFLKKFGAQANYIRRKKRADALITKADALLEKLKESDKTTVEISTTGLPKKMAMAGKVPDKLSEAFKTDMKTLNEVFSGYIPKHINYLEKVTGAIGKIMYDGSHGRITGVLEEIVKLTPPTEMIPAKAKDGTGFIGNKSIALKGTLVTGDDLTSKLKARYKIHPRVTKSKTVPSMPEKITLTKTEAVAIANSAKAYGVLLHKANDQLTKQTHHLSNFLSKFANAKIPQLGDLDWSEERALDYAVTLDVRSTYALLDTCHKMFKHGMESGKTALSIAGRFA